MARRNDGESYRERLLEGEREALACRGRNHERVRTGDQLAEAIVLHKRDQPAALVATSPVANSDEVVRGIACGQKHVETLLRDVAAGEERKEAIRR